MLKTTIFRSVNDTPRLRTIIYKYSKNCLWWESYPQYDTQGKAVIELKGKWSQHFSYDIVKVASKHKFL